MGASGMKRSLFIALAIALAGCADDTPRKSGPAPAASATYSPAPSVASPPPAPPPAPQPAADQCGLGELRGVVGKSRMEIPIPIEPGRRQVICETCPRSQDFVAGRQTVLFDARTGLVTSVSCG